VAGSLRFTVHMHALPTTRTINKRMQADNYPPQYGVLVPADAWEQHLPAAPSAIGKQQKLLGGPRRDLGSSPKREDRRRLTMPTEKTRHSSGVLPVEASSRQPRRQPRYSFGMPRSRLHPAASRRAAPTPRPTAPGEQKILPGRKDLMRGVNGKLVGRSWAAAPPLPRSSDRGRRPACGVPFSNALTLVGKPSTTSSGSQHRRLIGGAFQPSLPAFLQERNRR
jgi:hypothetical protein